MSTKTSNAPGMSRRLVTDSALARLSVRIWSRSESARERRVSCTAAPSVPDDCMMAPTSPSSGTPMTSASARSSSHGACICICAIRSASRIRSNTQPSQTEAARSSACTGPCAADICSATRSR
jgi:hypothetical protein